MNRETPAAQLLAAVHAKAAPGDELHVSTDARSYPNRVLVAVWRPAVSFVMSIDRAEYDGVKLAELLGFPHATPKTAMERIREQRP